MKKALIGIFVILFTGLCLTSCEQKQSGSGDPVEGIQKAMLLGRWNVIAGYRTEDGIKVEVVENHTPQGEYWIFYNDNMLQHGSIGDNTYSYAIGNTI